MAAHIHGFRDGSVAERLNLPTIRALAVLVPPLPEQKRIAHILGTLDDKTELNRRMNKTLEEMARALFKSWFIDFDPVRAKAKGRKPEGMDAATAKLFPSSFENSELGPLPKGWTVGRVSDVATLNRGAVNPGDFPTETFDHFSLPAFDNGRSPKVELGSAIMSNKFTVTPNSVLLSKLNPHIPRIWLPDLHASRRSVCSTEFMVACSKPSASREYLFSLFTSSVFASIYGTLVTGTTGSHQRIRPESVLDMKIVIPSAQLIRAFTEIAKPMFTCINRNTDQSHTLADMRETLLPRLLSGELSVVNATHTIGANL
jgi:type I restriction enzyme S subunit